MFLWLILHIIKDSLLRQRQQDLAYCGWKVALASTSQICNCRDSQVGWIDWT